MVGRRLWPALVLVCFCLPLFLGLRHTDLEGDEAGHSFSVDMILEHGGWLAPAQSPFPYLPFLEKPPLKFWIVAAGIKAGLPWDEFGIRVWDPLFATFAFLYLYGIGRRIGGPLAGFGAVSILFVHGPLIFAHGLRSNNMEAALVLSYCGGFYHYFRWASADERERRWPHAMAIAGYFALGFMVKFVAVAFLPLVLGLGTLIVTPYRRRFFADWRTWAGASLVALAIILPWYVWAFLRFGREFWDIIFGTHVYARFTSYLDPLHLQPWHFYFTHLWGILSATNTLWLVLAGAALLAVDVVRGRTPPRADVLFVFLWWAVPFAAISFGTSKLYHYSYAFLPPVGIAGGYVGAFLWNSVRPPILNRLQAVGRFSQARWLGRITGSSVVRSAFLVVAFLALVVMVWTYAAGEMVIRAGNRALFKNHQIVRPGVLAMLFAVLGGWPEAIGRVGVPLAIVAIMPVQGYHETILQISRGTRILRNTRDCILRVQAQADVMTPSGTRGMYLDSDGRDFETAFSHQYSYYLRKVRPWYRLQDTPPERLRQYLFDPLEERPVLIATSRYDLLVNEIRDEARARGEAAPAAPAVVQLESDGMMALPGPYAVCGPEPLPPGR